MNEQPRWNNPKSCDRFPDGLLYVPVRRGPMGCAARLFRTPSGNRTVVGFTSERRLVAALGPDQSWIRLAGPALRSLTRPLGVTTVTVDPQLDASVATPAAPHESRPEHAPRAAGAQGASQAPDERQAAGAAGRIGAVRTWTS